MPIVINDRIAIPDDEFDVAYARSGGAGGQHVNKTSSKVQLRFHLRASTALSAEVKARLRKAAPGRLTDDGDLLIVSERGRDQKANLEDAKDKLASLIRAHLLPPKPRTKTKPSKGSVRRRLQDKSARAQTKQARGRVRDA
jgi:ribosome-associated protein